MIKSEHTQSPFLEDRPPTLDEISVARPKTVPTFSFMQLHVIRSKFFPL